MELNTVLSVRGRLQARVMSDVCTYQGREELSRFSTLGKRRNTVSEKESLSQKPKVTFTPASDGDPMKEASSSVYDELCGNDSIFSDKTHLVDNNSFDCQLGGKNSGLNFIGNAENKDSNDFLYYGWPEIGNFEDIGGMLRSCNSTFDFGFSKEDDSGWLSSADGMKSDLKFPCPESDAVENISETLELSNGYSTNDSSVTSGPTRYKDNSWTSEDSDSYGKYGVIPQEQMKLQKQSEEKSKEHYSGNGNFNHISDLPNEAMQLPSGLTSHHVFPPAHMQNKLQNSFSHVKMSTVKSDTTDLTSISPRDSSNASSQLQYMETSHDRPFEMSALATVCEQKELGSSDVQENPTPSSSSVDTSLEATSFRRLQLVSEQLDSRMKLCIRDSLYRLAWSAEQRHNHAECGNGRDASGGASMAEATSFMDMETDTNPIDRSIAHLLFYRPNDASPFKSPSVLHGSGASPSEFIENSVPKEKPSQAEVVYHC